MTEIIEKGSLTRAKLQKGIDKLAETVSVTLGPKGRTVLIRNTFGDVIITKDGVTVAKEILLKDPVEAIGAELVKKVAMQANEQAGDGTSTSVVIAQALYAEGLKLLDDGANPLEIKKGIQAASELLLKKIKKSVKEITVKSPELESTIMISSNGSKSIAKTITDIYKELGPDAVISVEQGDSIETLVKIVKGMQFDKGYLSPYSLTDLKNRKIIFDNPLIFLYDGKIKNVMHIGEALQYAAQQARPIVFIADDIKEDALRTIVINYQNNVGQSAIVQGPGFSNKRLEYLEEIAILTGGTVRNAVSYESEGIAEHLGECDKMEITISDSVIVGGKGDKKKIDKLIQDLRDKIKEPSIEDYDKEKYEESLGKLTGGVSLIKVGAKSKTEGKELTDRIEDAKFAAKAALQEGIVEGGGMALWRNSIPTLYEMQKHPQKKDFAKGVEALVNAVIAPAFHIIKNAGISEPIEILKRLTVTEGYDALNETLVKDMIEAGIVDPFKVVRIALESAVSVVSTLLTTEYTIINLPSNKLGF